MEKVGSEPRISEFGLRIANLAELDIRELGMRIADVLIIGRRLTRSHTDQEIRNPKFSSRRGGAFGVGFHIALVVACAVITLIVVIVMRLNAQVVKHHTQNFRAHVL